MTTCYSPPSELPRIEDFQARAHTAVLTADSRLHQGLARAAVDAVFTRHPALGLKFEPFCGGWTSWPAGGWTWGVEPRGVAVTDVIARQRGNFDMRIGRLFAASLIPGAPDRLVLSASRLCMDEASWRMVVDDLLRESDGGTGLHFAKISARFTS